MLKSPSSNNRRYQESFSDSSSINQMMPMADESIEQFIYLLFKHSPKANCGTAPAYEWLQLLKQYNYHDGFYILTDFQLKSIKPYCEMNKDLEMTPEEFIKLIHLIRYGQPQPSLSTPTSALDSRPRSSKMLSHRSVSSYYDDKSSINHPSPMASPRSGEYHQNKQITLTRDGESSDLIVLKREKSLLKKQLREYDKRFLNLSNEHSERIKLLQSNIDNLKIEIDQQRVTINEQKNKEMDKLEKIHELTNIKNELDSKLELFNKKLNKKDREIESLLEKLNNSNELLSKTKTTLNASDIESLKLKELIKSIEKEKLEAIENGRLSSLTLKTENNALKAENSRLIELIDRQKIELSELQRYQLNNTPILNPTVNFDQEKLLNEYKQKLLKAESDLKVSLQAQQEQKERIKSLSSKFDQQLKLIKSIQLNLNPTAKTWIHIIPWSFLLLHLYLIALKFFIPNHQLPFFLIYLDEWLYKYVTLKN